MLTPRKLRNWIRRRLDARYSLCSVSRILRFLGFSSKRSATMYASAADADSVRRWQAGAAGTISGAKRRGFTIVVQGESIFLRTWTNGRKLWSRVGDPVTVNRRGRRDKAIVYGTLAEDGTRLMWQYGRFDGPTFVRYLKEMRRKWGRILLVTDNAKPAQAQGGAEVPGGSTTGWRSCTCLPRRRSSAQSSLYGRMQSTGLSLPSTTRRWRT